ncbi:MAG: hypothetical protein E6G39_12150 [Actinobacteria bacterium]|nr:MAG: hypothetical protein E6G39_12150 [Actinomycetota bacterium]
MGAVLAGGSSSRMGRDKALIEVAGEPLVQRVARALTAAGAERVVVIGGDRRRIEALGLEVVADRFPGEGPLGGVLTAMSAIDAPVMGARGAHQPRCRGARRRGTAPLSPCRLAAIGPRPARRGLPPRGASHQTGNTHIVGGRSGRRRPRGPCRCRYTRRAPSRSVTARRPVTTTIEGTPNPRQDVARPHECP